MSHKVAIKKTIQQFFHAMDSQNFELLKKVVASNADAVHIGTDTGEIWKGWKELKNATVEQFEGLEYYKADIYNLDIKISSPGDIAWYSHLLDARIKSNGREQVWQGARFTGVFGKQNNQWAMLQSHVSLPESAHIDEK